jgi:acyl-CoA synthetase (AMP-forming)/AMP-acid ligase II
MVSNGSEDFLALYASERPDKTVLIDDRAGAPPRLIGFAEFNRYVNRLANALLRTGVIAGDRVAWCGRNSVETVAMQQAARKIALTSVPLNYNLHTDEICWIIDNSDTVMVWTAAEFEHLFQNAKRQLSKLDVVVFDPDGNDPEFLEAGDTAEPPVPSLTSTATTIIYTSGTTGRPKGAVRDVLTSPEQRAILRSHLEMMGIGRDDIYLPTGSLHHGGPGSFADLTISQGNTVVLQRHFDPEDWLRLLSTYRASTSYSAPTAIRYICGLSPEVKARYDRSSMRVMIAGAAAWPYALKLAYLEDFPEDSLWELYGSTELGTNTILRPEDQRRKPGSCGQAAPGVEIVLLDGGGDVITAPGTPGELYVKGGSRFRTYHKDPETYEAEHRGQDLHTVGDIAYVDEDGFYYICDRKKDMIISGGVNVYPAEVEAVIESHPGVFETAVIGLPDEEWGERVHAVVVANAGHSLTADQVIEYCRSRVAHYKCPKSVSFMSELPHSGSGKVLKRDLKQFYETKVADQP